MNSFLGFLHSTLDQPRPARAKFFGEPQPRVHQVGGENVDAAQLQDFGEHEADGPLPGDEHVVAAQDGEAFDGFQNGVDGFQHRAFYEGVARGNFHDAGQDERHHADVFGIAAAGGFEAGGDAGAFVLGALGEGAVAAEMAFHAGNVMMQARRGRRFAKAAHARADAHDGAGGFMAENARRGHGAVMDFFDVGRANAAGGDLDEQFAGADARDGNGFEAQIVRRRDKRSARMVFGMAGTACI